MCTQVSLAYTARSLHVCMLPHLLDRQVHVCVWGVHRGGLRHSGATRQNGRPAGLGKRPHHSHMACREEGGREALSCALQGRPTGLDHQRLDQSSAVCMVMRASPPRSRGMCGGAPCQVLYSPGLERSLFRRRYSTSWPLLARAWASTGPGSTCQPCWRPSLLTHSCCWLASSTCTGCQWGQKGTACGCAVAAV